MELAGTCSVSIGTEKPSAQTFSGYAYLAGVGDDRWDICIYCSFWAPDVATEVSVSETYTYIISHDEHTNSAELSHA